MDEIKFDELEANGNTLNRDRIQLWLEALRSGEYRQVHGTLGSEGGYCCLGVACEVAIKNGPVVNRRLDGVVSYDGSSNLLPNSVVDWFGLPGQGPQVQRRNPVHED